VIKQSKVVMACESEREIGRETERVQSGADQRATIGFSQNRRKWRQNGAVFLFPFVLPRGNKKGKKFEKDVQEERVCLRGMKVIEELSVFERDESD
jgi:hypothetical protein